MGARSNSHQRVGGKQYFDSEVQVDASLHGVNIYFDELVQNSHNYIHTSLPRSINRQYLEENFNHLPGIAADQAATGGSNHSAVNRELMIEGANSTSALVTYLADGAGATLTTAAVDEDSMIVSPHSVSKQSAGGNTLFGTENEVSWEASIRTDAIDNQDVWAGLKLSNTEVAITDTDQAYFTYGTAAEFFQTLSTTDNTAMNIDGTGMGWHFIYSINDVFYTTNLNLAVVADTVYHLKIVIDSDRKVSAYINGTQYGLVSDAGHGNGISNAGTDNTAWGSTNTLVNGASGESTSASEITIVVDGTDARTTFKPGDYVHVADTAVPVGKVKSVSELAIVLESLDATIADDLDLFNYGQLAYSATEKSKALKTAMNLKPFIGIQATGGAAEVLHVHWQAISRKISE